MKVSYDKKTRDTALAERKGLCCVEFVKPGKKPGKFGIKLTMQWPATEDEIKDVSDFMQASIEKRTAKEK